MAHGMLLVRHVQSQRSAMGFKPLNIEDLKTVGGHKLFGSQEGKIRKMLMIDRVKLHALHQAKKVREFNRQHALWLQHDLEAADEVVQVGYVREDIVRNDQVCTKAPPDQFLG